ncbi:MAG: cytochrome c3 family protein [Myxococcota bacterium]
MSALLAITSALALLQLPPGPEVSRAVDAGVVLQTLDGSAHDLLLRSQRHQEDDLCALCHVPSLGARAGVEPPRWAPGAVTRSSALDVRADPLGPPLALRWAGSTLRCLSCHDETVSSLGVTFRPASDSLNADALAGDARRRTGLGGPALLPPQWWTHEVMGNHPVSVPYPVGGNGYRDFAARAQPIDPRQWVLDPGARGLKLLSDSSGFDALRGTAGVECVTCHAGHATPHRAFLRLPAERSELCLACHVK